MSDKSLMLRIGLRPLKRNACTGCEICGWMDEYLSEDMINEMIVDFDGIKHGRLYTIIVEGDDEDWNFRVTELNEDITKEKRHDVR